MPLGIKPTVDFAFKKIFGSPESVDALIGLLNDILALPRPITQVDVRHPFNYQELPNAVEVHTVELTKYTLGEDTISQAGKIEQWAFFLLFADQYEPRRLRELLPAIEFQEAITIIEQIASKTEDRTMYDQREKAERDHQWLREGALNARP